MKLLLLGTTVLAALAAVLAAQVDQRDGQLRILPVDLNDLEGQLEAGLGMVREGLAQAAERLEEFWDGEECEEDELDAEDGEEVLAVAGKTAYEILSENEQFSKLLFLINQDPLSISFLSSPKSPPFTFLAPLNTAFPATPAHHLPAELGNPLSLELLHRYFSRFPNGSGRLHFLAVRVLHALLQYHLLPHPHSFHSLLENSTAPTSLTIPGGALLGQPQRIQLSPGLRPFPTVQLNFAGHITHPDLWAENGAVLHGITAALQPGLSIMEQMYAVPWLFPASGLEAPFIFEVTAASLARTGLDSVVQYKPVFKLPSGSFPASASEEELATAMEERAIELAAAYLSLSPSDANSNGPIPGLPQPPSLKWTGSPALTLFAPTNGAWAKLPPKLGKWLFSPFGDWALEKLLRYHLVNGTVVQGDWIYPPQRPGEPNSGALAEAAEAGTEEALWPAYDFTQHFPTLLPNTTLPVRIVKRKLLPLPKQGEVAQYRIWAGGVEVAVRDGVARNGVWQGVERVLNPLRGRKEGEKGASEEGEWEGWEDWFVRWAMEA